MPTFYFVNFTHYFWLNGDVIIDSVNKYIQLNQLQFIYFFHMEIQISSFLKNKNTKEQLSID